MKSLLFTLALTLTTAAFAICEPNTVAGSSSDIKTIISGSETTGKVAQKELNKSQPQMKSDLLGRVMFTESNSTIQAVQSLEIVKDDIYSNSRIDRYCSASAGLNNARCISLCIKWTNYLSHP